VASASASDILDQVSIDGGEFIESKHSSRPTFGDIPPVEANFDLELVSYQLK
jgi:hypothetical protein